MILGVVRVADARVMSDAHLWLDGPVHVHSVLLVGLVISGESRGDLSLNIVYFLYRRLTLVEIWLLLIGKSIQPVLLWLLVVGKNVVVFLTEVFFSQFQRSL